MASTAPLVLVSICGFLCAPPMKGATGATGAAGQVAGIPGSPAAQETGQAPVRRSLGAMGTWLEVEVEAETRSQALAASEAAVRAVEATEARLSTWRAGTELSILNGDGAGKAEGPTRLSPALRSELARALELARRTDGAFDPVCGSLVEAYGLRDGGRWPTSSELAQALSFSGHERVQLVDGELRRAAAGVRIEEGGFGKGAGLDAALAALRAVGIRSACVDLGGQVAFVGDPREFPVADPRDRERACLTISLDAGSFATTANSERGTLVDGRFLSHVLDPRTGLPAPDFGSVGVWARDALTADALSTGLFVLGPEAALAYAALDPTIEVIVIETVQDRMKRDRLRVRTSAGLTDRVRDLAPYVVLNPRDSDADESPVSDTAGFDG